MSTWSKVGNLSEYTSNLRGAARAVLVILKTRYGLNSSMSKLYQVSLYNLFKRLHEKHHVSPEDTLLVFSKNPHFVELVYKNKYKDLQQAIIHGADVDASKEVILVTLYYDALKSMHKDKAIQRAKKYPYIQFSEEFIDATLKKYPYLMDDKHIEHVLSHLKSLEYAVFLTDRGIKEVYNVS